MVDSTPRPYLQVQPGYLVRRLQQAAVALFMAQTAEQALTPVQFAAMIAVAASDGTDGWQTASMWAPGPMCSRYPTR